MDRAGFRESAELAADFARRCHHRNGTVLPHAGTPDAARDMDVIRSALDERRISCFGTSWGAHLGAVYSELFPRRVDRMVLDSSNDLIDAAHGRPITPSDELAERLALFAADDPMIDGVLAASWATMCNDAGWPSGPAPYCVTADVRSHGAYGRGTEGYTPIPCIDAAVNDYLRDGTLPHRDTSCG